MVRQGAPEAVKPVFDAAREVQDFLRLSGSELCFIGGIALQRWGQPRFTREVDLTLRCQLGREGGVIDSVLGGFAARIPDARTFVLKNCVILLQSGTGVPIDVALAHCPSSVIVSSARANSTSAPVCTRSPARRRTWWF